MSSAKLHFGHSAPPIAAEILWERFQKRNPESAGAAVPSQQTGLPFERPAASTVDCDSYKGAADARHAMPFEQVDSVSFSRNIG
jgi:hypothetical protein